MGKRLTLAERGRNDVFKINDDDDDDGPKCRICCRVGILSSKTYFCQDSGKNRDLQVFPFFFQNHIKLV